MYKYKPLLRLFVVSQLLPISDMNRYVGEASRGDIGIFIFMKRFTQFFLGRMFHPNEVIGNLYLDVRLNFSFIFNSICIIPT